MRRIHSWALTTLLVVATTGCHRLGDRGPVAAANSDPAGHYAAHPPYGGAYPQPYGAYPAPYGTYPQPYGAYPAPSQPWGYGHGYPAPGPGPTGWASTGPPSFGPAPGMQAAAFAQSVQGRPYCWGGTGPECFDCSGLTYAAWRAAGKTIPRTSADQRDQLVPVAMAALQPGDILWRPGHVGIYVGNGWVVHAPRKGEPVGPQPAQAYREAFRP